MAENLLKHETSPYLLQHADNPVHWRPWGSEAFAEARRADKPVLLSVGYAACHWCHVMAHESFEDPDVADVMNELFVNIKVDREERPDVDQLYMSALHHLGEQGGWPLTMFLTPAGEPVWGGTYFPKEPKWGRPGFVQVLREFERIYRSEPDKVEHNRTALAARLSAAPFGAEGDLFPGLAVTAARRLVGLLDPVNGGIKGAPKFPQASLLELLWHAGDAAGEAAMHDAVLHALRRMARGGIWDHVGGGFSRYTVDERWLVPHFEKMLYDNAQLLDLLVRAWLRTGDALFRHRIESLVEWLKREMLAEGGAFAASIDADSEGVEGLYYTWTGAEIDDALSDDTALFRRAYGVTDAGNFEGRNILNRLDDPFPLSDAEEARLADCRATLLALRTSRIPPERDDKALADWNGLAIAAVARAAAALKRPDWHEMATRAYGFVMETMHRDGRLAHAHRNGKQVFPGLASDHAAMARAALALHETTAEPAYLANARALLDALERWHRDAEAGGYLLAPGDSDDLVHRLRSAQDDAMPNHNALAAEALVRIHHLTGDAEALTRADAVFEAFKGQILANAFAHAGLVAAFDLRLAPVQVVVVGEAGDDATAALREAALGTGEANVILQTRAPGDELPAGHPARGKGQSDGRATAYVCVWETCSLPVTEPNRLREAVSRRAA